MWQLLINQLGNNNLERRVNPNSDELRVNGKKECKRHPSILELFIWMERKGLTE